MAQCHPSSSYLGAAPEAGKVLRSYARPVRSRFHQPRTHQQRVSRTRYVARMTQLRSFRTARQFSLALAAVAIVGSAAFTPTIPAKAGDHDKEARRDRELREIRTAVSRGQVLPLPRIIAIAQGRVKGDVVKIEIEKENGALIYEVKILTTKGRVREVELDARTGAILSVEND